MTFEEVENHGPLFLKLYNVIVDDKVIGKVAKIKARLSLKIKGTRFSKQGVERHFWVPVIPNRGVDYHLKADTRQQAAEYLPR